MSTLEMINVLGNVMVTSDTHFGHEKIIKYTNRPFQSARGDLLVRNMDEAMIAHWNTVVSEDQLVIHLGDFSFRPDQYIRKLNGRILLVQGNHDKPSFNNLFYGVVQFLPLQIREFKCFLTHRPLVIDDEYDRKDAMRLDPKIIDDYDFIIHGHKHGVWKVSGKHIDVGIDAWGGRIISCDELIEFMRKVKLENIEHMEPERWV
jgi:calcineurin-like phosphoesterase family protein